MALEEAVNACTAAVLKLADIMTKGGAAPAGAPATRGPGRPKKITIDELKAVGQKVIDEKGRPVYFQLTKSFDIKQLAELDESKYPAFIAAAEVLIAAAAEEEAATDEL